MNLVFSHRVSYVAGSAALVMALAVALAPLLGLNLSEGLLMSLKLNAVLGIFCLAVALLLNQPPASPRWLKLWRISLFVFTLTAAVIGGITLVEFFLPHDFVGIDNFWQLHWRGQTSLFTPGLLEPGRLAPSTAVNLTLCGLGGGLILLLPPRSRATPWGQFLVMLSFLASLQGFLGNLGGMNYLVGRALLTQMTLPMSLSFICLSVGFLAARPRAGWMAVLSADSPAGYMARRLLAAAILVPPLMTGLQALGEKYQLFDPEFGSLLRVMGNIVFLAFLVVVTASRLHRSEMRRQEIEAAARAREERFQRLFETQILGLVSFNQRGEILDANEAFLAMTGFSQADLKARHVTWKELTPPEWQDRDRMAWAELKRRGTMTPFEQEFSRKDGSRFPVYLGAALFSDARNEGVAYVMDVSARKQTEHRLRESLDKLRGREEDLKRAIRIRDEFLSTLSHELRTPLNVILGWAQILQTETLDDETLHRGLEALDRNARLQNELVDNLLDASRIITGRLNLSAQAVNLSEVARRALASVAVAAEAKHLELDCQVNPHQDCWVSGDADRLHQILWNLLSNSVKFTPPYGRIRLSLEAEGNQARLEVSDTGLGIEADFLPHVFERFRQEDGSTTRRFGGVGLGLALVRHLVELHGGQVSASSAGRHQGTNFTLTFPLIEAPTTRFSERAAKQPTSLNA